MKVEIITTGEEVLSGQILDTNASWLSEILQQAGLPVTRRTTLGDRREDLVQGLLERSKVADLIIVNGGLGPTVDDLSAEVAGLALAEPLLRFEAWVKVLEERFAKMGRTMSPSNLKQALLPRSAEIIDNPVGTACGFVIRLNGAELYFTPGVPHELKRMIRGEILPRILKQSGIRTHSLLKRLHTFGLAESHVGELLQTIELPSGLSLGFRTHIPSIEVKIMGRGPALSALEAQMEAAVAAVRGVLGEWVFCEDDYGLACQIQALMVSKGHRLALAESCTGGMISEQLVSVADSSQYFERGYVTYSNAAKIEMLAVPAELIKAHGAVSLQVARAMACGARTHAPVSHALAVTGLAGPGGGTAEKPVGTVGFALATAEGVVSQVLVLPDWGRTRIRLLAAAIALDMLRRHLTGLPVCATYDLLIRREMDPV